MPPSSFHGRGLGDAQPEPAQHNPATTELYTNSKARWRLAAMGFGTIVHFGFWTGITVQALADYGLVREGAEGVAEAFNNPVWTVLGTALAGGFIGLTHHFSDNTVRSVEVVRNVHPLTLEFTYFSFLGRAGRSRMVTIDDIEEWNEDQGLISIKFKGENLFHGLEKDLEHLRNRGEIVRFLTSSRFRGSEPLRTVEKVDQAKLSQREFEKLQEREAKRQARRERRKARK